MKEDIACPRFSPCHHSTGLQRPCHFLICATDSAFAALRRDGTVVTWGEEGHGGDSSKVQGELKEVMVLCAAGVLFTAVRSDGCVVTWGRGKDLPNYPCYEIRGECSNMGLTDAVAICGSSSAFAALRQNGTVTTWNLRGFVSDSLGSVAELKDIVEIGAASNVFAALRRDGKVATWSDTKTHTNSPFFAVPAAIKMMETSKQTSKNRKGGQSCNKK